MSSPEVGLVGCGNMGSAIAARLAPQVPLAVVDLDGGKAQEVATATGATAVRSVAELGAASAVVLSLPVTDASRAVVDELCAVLRNGAVVIETSTVNPGDMHAMAVPCAAAGVHLVDAAVLSGVTQMREGTTTLLIGGEDAAIAAAQSVLDLLSPRQRRIGPLGAGMAAKVANNAVSHAVMVVLLEAAAMAEASGVPPGVFAEMLADPDAGLLRPLAHRLRERVFSGDYARGMRLDAARKDSQLALELAGKHGVPLFAIQAAHTVYELGLAAGLGADDYAVLARLWEDWAGRPLWGGGAAG